MGYSAPYNVFTGAAEMLAGLLLFPRRTTTLGALLSAAVMSHVVVLNFCFDVPVKLFSLHLLGLAVLLLVPDLGRLAAFFLANRPTEPAPVPSLFERPAWHRSALALRGAFLAVVVGFSLLRSWQARTFWDLAPRPPLWGLYEVEPFAPDGQASRWHYLAIEKTHFLAAVLTDGSVRYYDWSVDTAKRTLRLKSRGRAPRESELSYLETAAGGLALEGRLEGAPFAVVLRRRDPSQLPLLSRGFHWINEYPYNR
jgi:hypothetical protein